MDKESLFVIRSEEQNTRINCQDLEILDISDAEEDNCRIERGKTWIAKGEPISLSLAKEAKQVILGSDLSQFSDEWRNQYFVFNHFYGLVQKKGGPCGLLASVQAYILIELFFNKQTTKEICLINAISSILWKIGRKKSVTVVHEITEKLVLNTFECLEELSEHINKVIKQFSCISFLYSCVLTKGVKELREEMDDKKTTLIGKHNYCSQEMVNLLLVGRAVSNVFNNDIKCDSLTLHGIYGQSQIGFLSLHEYYKCCEVGSNYKNPQFPIFVILSESHFSVLFSKTRIEKKKEFQLFYYDGLAQQQQEIILKIIESDCPSETNIPLECVIRTKWPKAQIEWNNEKIL